jgi:protoheme ferro-lyase
MPEEWNSLLLLLKQVGWAAAVGAGALAYAMKEVFRSRDALTDRLVQHIQSIDEDRRRDQAQYAKAIENMSSSHDAVVRQIYEQQLQRELHFNSTSAHMITTLAQAVETISNSRKGKDDERS